MPLEPPIPTSISLLVAETPRAGAAAFRPTTHDVAFISHDDLSRDPERLDTDSIAEVFVSLGPHQHEALGALIGLMRHDDDLAPALYVEIPADISSTDSLALHALLRDVEALTSSREATGNVPPQLFLHAADNPEPDLLFEVARLRATEIRRQVAALDAPKSAPPLPTGESDAERVRTAYRLEDLDAQVIGQARALARKDERLKKQRERLQKQRGRLMAQGKQIAQLRRRAARQGRRIAHLDAALTDEMSQRRVATWQRLVPHRLLAVLRARVSPRAPRVILAMAAALFSAASLTVAWVSLGVAGALVALLGSLALALIALVLLELASLRAENKRVYHVAAGTAAEEALAQKQFRRRMRHVEVSLRALGDETKRSSDEMHSTQARSLTDFITHLSKLERTLVAASVNAAQASAEYSLPHLRALQDAVVDCAGDVHDLQRAHAALAGREDLDLLEARLTDVTTATADQAAQAGHESLQAGVAQLNRLEESLSSHASDFRAYTDGAARQDDLRQLETQLTDAATAAADIAGQVARDAATAASQAELSQLRRLEEALTHHATDFRAFTDDAVSHDDLRRLETQIAETASAVRDSAREASSPVEIDKVAQLQKSLDSYAAELLSRLDADKKGDSATADDLRGFERRMNLARVHQTEQLEAAVNLFTMLPVSAPVPAMGGWAASPDLIRFLTLEMLRIKPRTIVECGSGVSTLWFAVMARHLGLDTRIVALEHDERFRLATMKVLSDHGLQDVAEVRLAPISPMDGPDSPQWYDLAATADLSNIGLLLVDGPPATLGPLARYPAVPVLQSKLAPSCLIVLDDMVRQDEKDIAARWQSELPDFTYEMVNLDKGAGCFRRGDSSA